MPHLPSFPPDFYYDLAPGDPFKGESPLPGFIRHSSGWLTADQRAEIEAVAGRWACNRAESMVPPSAGVETVRRIAISMSESYRSRALAGLPPVAPPKPKRKPARKEIEELARVMKPELTPELEERLTSSVRDAVEIEGRLRRPMTTEYKMELARSVVVWAEEEGVTIPESEGLRIVEKAVAGLVPAGR